MIYYIIYYKSKLISAEKSKISFFHTPYSILICCSISELDINKTLVNC